MCKTTDHYIYIYTYNSETITNSHKLNKFKIAIELISQNGDLKWQKETCA